MPSWISQAAVREMVARLSAPKVIPSIVVQETRARKISQAATRDLFARLTSPRTNCLHAQEQLVETHRRNLLKISKKKERELVDRLSTPKMRREKLNSAQREEPVQARPRLTRQSKQRLEQSHQVEQVQHHPFMKLPDLAPVQITMVQVISPTVEVVVVTLATSVFRVDFVSLHVKEQLQIAQSPQVAHISRELVFSSFEAPEPVFFKMDGPQVQCKKEALASSIEARRERALKMHFYRHGILSLTQVNSAVPAFRAVFQARHPNYFVA